MIISQKEIGQRIKVALTEAKVTQRTLSKALGVSEPSVSAYIQGTSNPPAEAYAIISDICGVSIDWLIKGSDHHPFFGNPDKLTPTEAAKLDAELLPSGHKRAAVYHLGGAGFPHDLESYEPISSIVLPQEFLKPSMVPIQITGRSMEPILHHGAYVGVDRGDKQVISGEIYAVYLPYEGMVVKRIYMATDHVILKSDNPSFPELTIPIEKVDPDNFILGRVKWVLQEF